MPVAAAANWSKSQTISAETMGPQILVDIVVFVAVIVDGRPKMDCCHGHKFTVALLFFHFFPLLCPPSLHFVSVHKTATHIWPEKHRAHRTSALYGTQYVFVLVVCVCRFYTPEVQSI